ncbi:hypothetical protein [Paenibacillus flagellatus]|uniref:Uncharacterized protein n=1 Tax=Paenibacillus flagellatus TaxID=2211139 RepID=A0A2V5KBQ3_9BACL|nr:hypothetical protein [Paenibacillus flagellatus]PYI56999.1 hypothetical protein DLM86_00695 [Paenibacillus flagellatus]
MEDNLLKENVIEACEQNAKTLNDDLMKYIDILRSVVPLEHRKILLDVEEVFYEKSRIVANVAYEYGKTGKVPTSD